MGSGGGVNTMLNCRADQQRKSFYAPPGVSTGERGNGGLKDTQSRFHRCLILNAVERACAIQDIYNGRWVRSMFKVRSVRR